MAKVPAGNKLEDEVALLREEILELRLVLGRTAKVVTHAVMLLCPQSSDTYRKNRRMIIEQELDAI